MKRSGAQWSYAASAFLPVSAAVTAPATAVIKETGTPFPIRACLSSLLLAART